MKGRTMRLTTEVRASPESCFDLSRSIDLHVESMTRSRERAIAGVTSGLIGADQEVTWEAHHLGLRWRVTSRITEFDPPNRFVDEMIRGPFSRFRHEHLFEPTSGGTRMQDVVEFRMRGGPLSAIADPFAGWYLRRLLILRNDLIKSKAESPRTNERGREPS
jgi:ligand-binding SRPBCC domain-containing protein